MAEPRTTPQQTTPSAAPGAAVGTTDDPTTGTTGRARPATPRRAVRRRGLTLHETVLIAVLGVVFGFVYWAFVQLWAPLQLAMGPLADLAANVLAGAWIVVGPLATYIVRKPGVGILAETLAALVEVVFLASPAGPLLLLVGLVQGLGAELPFALTRYRRFGWWVFVACGVSAALVTFAFNAVRFGWLGQDYAMLRLGVQVVSCVVLCGLTARLLGDALARTGALDAFAIGAARRG
ncbi:thiamine ABC transporter permease [Cellulosimicrobium funkei]|uniref:Thiamine ABC transporter permease n=1 Tax=Cellulosimicrobium funkei TaxID=264251 RepID=A0A0H2KMK0_9MICO|nr:ECF transporter S component [Cellulosimicrobium funkei]KLN33074.1 thiamine ABC transporter permease [Cellulosimicrobium funkei]